MEARYKLTGFHLLRDDDGGREIVTEPQILGDFVVPAYVPRIDLQEVPTAESSAG